MLVICAKLHRNVLICRKRVFKIWSKCLINETNMEIMERIVQLEYLFCSESTKNDCSQFGDWWICSGAGIGLDSALSLKTLSWRENCIHGIGIQATLLCITSCKDTPWPIVHVLVWIFRELLYNPWLWCLPTQLTFTAASTFPLL